MHVDVKGSTDKDFQIALSIFKSKVKKAGIMEDLRKHEYYVKPSAKRRLKRAEARKRRRREQYDKRKAY